MMNILPILSLGSKLRDGPHFKVLTFQVVLRMKIM